MRELKPDERLIVDFILESDAIENIFSDPDYVVRRVVQKQQKGHIGALLALEILANDPQNNYVDKNLVCNIQKLIVEEQSEKGQRMLQQDQVGQYRKISVWIVHEGEKIFLVPPEEIENKMAALLAWTRWLQENARFSSEETNIARIASFHYRFLLIHPFADGNGRTARALTYYLMQSSCIVPFVFTFHDKHEKYYPCFRYPNSHLMEEYFKEKYQESQKGGR
ncbi:MAG: Fic family protein [bacterium]|nr:Fic family protein [bacterium]